MSAAESRSSFKVFVEGKDGSEAWIDSAVDFKQAVGKANAAFSCFSGPRCKVVVRNHSGAEVYARALESVGGA